MIYLTKIIIFFFAVGGLYGLFSTLDAIRAARNSGPGPTPGQRRAMREDCRSKGL